MSKLLEEILDKGNIDLAIKRVKSNKGAPGVDSMTTNEVENYFLENGEEILNKDQNWLRNNKNSSRDITNTNKNRILNNILSIIFKYSNHRECIDKNKY